MGCFKKIKNPLPALPDKVKGAEGGEKGITEKGGPAALSNQRPSNRGSSGDVVKGSFPTTGCTRSQVKCGVLEGGGVSGILGWRCYQAVLGGVNYIAGFEHLLRKHVQLAGCSGVTASPSPNSPPAKPVRQRKLPAWMFVPTWGNNHHNSFSQSFELRHRNHFWTNNCTFRRIFMTPFRFFDVSVLGRGSLKVIPTHLFQTLLPPFLGMSPRACRCGRLSPLPLATITGLIFNF